MAQFQPRMTYSDLVQMPAREYRQHALAEMAQVGPGQGARCYRAAGLISWLLPGAAWLVGHAKACTSAKKAQQHITLNRATSLLGRRTRWGLCALRSSL